MEEFGRGGSFRRGRFAEGSAGNAANWDPRAHDLLVFQGLVATSSSRSHAAPMMVAASMPKCR